ncbi:MAG: hypothetical protein WC803_12635 [Sphingomonas sp.]|jgi:hypothetical protein
MTDFVANPATAQAVINASSDGDTIILDPSDAYGVLTVTGKQGLTLRASVPTVPEGVPGFAGNHPARGTRSVTIRRLLLVNSSDCVFEDLHFRCTAYPDTVTGERWADYPEYCPTFSSRDDSQASAIVQADNVSHHPVFTRCQFSWGRGNGAAQVPFDPTDETYPEYQSGHWASDYYNSPGREDPYQPWWIRDDGGAGTIAPNGRAYNPIGLGPAGFYHLSSGSSPYGARAAEFHACDFADLTSAIISNSRGGKLIIDQVWFRRIYKDFIGGGTVQGSALTPDGWQITRSIAEHQFSQPSDASNAHGDLFQHNNYRTGLPRFNDIEVGRLFYLRRPDDRGDGNQSIFFAGPGSHLAINNCVYVDPFVHDLMLVNGGTNKGIHFFPAEDGDFAYNQAIGRPTAANVTASDINVTALPGANGGRTRLLNNVSDVITILPNSAPYGNVLVGNSYTTIAATDLMTGPFPPAPDTAAAWFAALQRKPAYAGKGPRWSGLEAFVIDPLRYDDIALFAGFAAKSPVATSAVVVSDKSKLRAPRDGTSIGLSVDIGEYQLTDPVTGDVTLAWRSTPSTGDYVGQDIQLRHTTSASNSTSLTQTLTMTHGVQATATAGFRATTISANAYPLVVFNGTTSSWTRATGAIAADSSLMTFALRFTPNNVTVTQDIFSCASTSRAMRVYMLTTTRVRIGVRNAAAAAIMQLDTPNLTAGHDYSIMVSCDLSSAAPVFVGYIIDHTAGTAPSVLTATILSQGTIQWSFNAAWNLGGPALPQMQLGMVYFDPTRFVDFALPDNQARIVSPDLIGADGAGLTGTAPLVFFAGDAAFYNEGTSSTNNINLGTGSAWRKTATASVTAGNSATWPPPLEIAATPLGSGPYLAGEIVDVMLQPAGYARVGTITPTLLSGQGDVGGAVSLPAGTDGAVMHYAPERAGNHIIGFANDLGYGNPANITLPVDHIVPMRLSAAGVPDYDTAIRVVAS